MRRQVGEEQICVLVQFSPRCRRLSARRRRAGKEEKEAEGQGISAQGDAGFSCWEGRGVFWVRAAGQS